MEGVKKLTLLLIGNIALSSPLPPPPACVVGDKQIFFIKICMLYCDHSNLNAYIYITTTMNAFTTK